MIFIVKVEYPRNFGTVRDSTIVGFYNTYKDAENAWGKMTRYQGGSTFITAITDEAVEQLKAIMERKSE